MIHFNQSLLYLGLLCLLGQNTLADIYSYHAPDQTIYLTNQTELKNKNYHRSVKTPAPIQSSTVSLSYQAKYQPLIQSLAKQYQLSERLIHAIIAVESAYNPQAVSKKGAVGLMQLMPQTAKRFGVKNRRNAKQNITGGIRFLSYLMKKFNANLPLVVAAYNAGEQAVIKYQGIPPYPETRQYVIKVLSRYLEG